MESVSKSGDSAQNPGQRVNERYGDFTTASIGSRGQLEDRSRIVDTAEVGGAVEIAVRVPEQRGFGQYSVLPCCRELIQHMRTTAGVELENGPAPPPGTATPGDAALVGGDVEVALRVSNQRGIGKCPVAISRPREGIQNRFVPRAVQFENHAARIVLTLVRNALTVAAFIGGTVKVAARVQ